jgi:hypothetical protein
VVSGMLEEAPVSAALTADSAAPIASTNASLVLAAALPSRFLILAKASSIGLYSGE